MSQSGLRGGRVNLIETMSQNLQFFFFEGFPNFFHCKMEENPGSKGSLIKRRRMKSGQWNNIEALPGWKYKTHIGGNYKTGKIFKSPEGEYFKGKSSVMKFMLNNNYPSEDILSL